MAKRKVGLIAEGQAVLFIALSAIIPFGKNSRPGVRFRKSSGKDSWRWFRGGEQRNMIGVPGNLPA